MKFDANKKLLALLTLCFVGLLMLGCVTPQNENITNVTNATIGNPASVYCVQNDGVSKIVTAADGSQSGICVFPDGSQCDEWAYYRGECSPEANQTVVQASANISNLDESDFVVIDDSMPNLITSQETPEAPKTG